MRLAVAIALLGVCVPVLYEVRTYSVCMVRFGCLFTRKPGLGYSRGDKYSQAGGWTTGYPLITPESSRGVPTTFSNLKALAYMRQPDPLPPTV